MKPRCSATRRSRSARRGRVAAEEVEHVLCGAHRALDPAQRVAGAQVFQPVVGDEQLVGGAREALAERGGLGGDVVAAPGQHQLGVLGGAAGQAGEDGDGAVAHVLQRQPDLQLLDVLGEVAAGHALVDVLVPRQRGELLDARLDVVAGDALAGGDGGEVDVRRRRARSPRSRRRARGRRGRAGRRARRSTAAAPARPWTPATRAPPAPGSRSGRRGRWGSRPVSLRPARPRPPPRPPHRKTPAPPPHDHRFGAEAAGSGRLTHRTGDHGAGGSPASGGARRGRRRGGRGRPR